MPSKQDNFPVVLHASVSSGISLVQSQSQSLSVWTGGGSSSSSRMARVECLTRQGEDVCEFMEPEWPGRHERIWRRAVETISVAIELPVWRLWLKFKDQFQFDREALMWHFKRVCYGLVLKNWLACAGWWLLLFAAALALNRIKINGKKVRAKWPFSNKSKSHYDL